MGALRIGAWLRRPSRRFAVLLVVLGLAAAVVAHHSVPSGMGGMHGDHATAPMATCLGVVSGVLAVPAIVGTVRLPRRQRPGAPRCARVDVLWVPTGPVPRARSSPLYLRHAVLRR